MSGDIRTALQTDLRTTRRIGTRHPTASDTAGRRPAPAAGRQHAPHESSARTAAPSAPAYLAMGQVTEANKADLIKKEVLVSIINGILWGAIAGLCAWGLYWDAPEGRMLGLVMFLAMLLNIIQGAVVGLAVPLILRYFGRDPAMGGSVLLTFTTDSGGFLIFLGLATFFFAS